MALGVNGCCVKSLGVSGCCVKSLGVSGCCVSHWRSMGAVLSHWELAEDVARWYHVTQLSWESHRRTSKETIP